MKIAIIGAGPAGSYLAYLLAKEGFKVELFDQKKAEQIGEPVQCTGLLTSEIRRFLPLSPGFLVNTFSQVEVVSPDGGKITFNKMEYLVDRKKFDRYLLNLALRAGAVFYPEHKLVGITRKEKKKIELTFQNREEIKIVSPSLVVGADGPFSLVYQYLNPGREKRFYYGLQAKVKGNFNPGAYQAFLGQGVCPNLFGWQVPESKNGARVGLATLRNPNFYFNNFLKKLGIKQEDILERQGGLIPLFEPKINFQEKGIYLLGDAASQVKATTLGGVVPAFQEAYNLAKSISQRKHYKPELKNLKLHLFLRRILNKFSDEDYNKLVRLLSKPRNKKILEVYSRERPRKLLKKLLLNEPRLLYFAKHLF